MPAWKRFGTWTAVLVGSMLGAQAQAGPFGSGGSSWNLWSNGNSGVNANTWAVTPAAAPSLSNAPVLAISSAPVSAPDVTSAPVSTPAPAPVAAVPTLATAAAVAAATPAPTANAFINLGSGPYPETGTIASGNPQPWYTSPAVATVFGGTPTPQQQTAFDSEVLQIVQHTFQLSGVAVNLTTDPSVSAAHTLSVAANTSSIPFPGSIGTTYLGGNGFSFIDQEAPMAKSVDQLATIVAHNVAHELMLSFGVPENYDQTGNYIDATHASWSMITGADSTFSPAAASALNQALESQATTTQGAQLAQYTQPVPEPATIALWSCAGLAFLAHRHVKTRRSAR